MSRCPSRLFALGGLERRIRNVIGWVTRGPPTGTRGGNPRSCTSAPWSTLALIAHPTSVPIVLSSHSPLGPLGGSRIRRRYRALSARAHAQKYILLFAPVIVVFGRRTSKVLGGLLHHRELDHDTLLELDQQKGAYSWLEARVKGEDEGATERNETQRPE